MSVKKGKKSLKDLNVETLTKHQEKHVKGGSGNGTDGVITTIQPD